jgi:hypothetical protein
MTLRAEAYNLFDLANLGLPPKNVIARDAGRITALVFHYQMRCLQYALPFEF